MDVGLLVKENIHRFYVLVQQTAAASDCCAILPPVQDSAGSALFLVGSTLECAWLYLKIILEAVNLKK